ncbi:hypothetical protein HELRODRAFT_82121, partial [Helobdella robusta]|uniref:Tyrosine specific protein phosphatases domain-containing protein n=1 Tax=Helobdella robusta TaxID=6412 RepID=T1G4N2_HELRO
ERWENYEAIGKLISGTRFIAFKVPLAEKFNRHLPLGVTPFTPHLLVEEVKRQNFKLGLVIDLTNTNKYYLDKVGFITYFKYKKIYTEGHKVPNAKVIKQFFAAVDTFLKENNDNSDVIGVHCTHGINRTGYLICRLVS